MASYSNNSCSTRGRDGVIYYDQHTLNATTGNLSKEEVVNAFNSALVEAKKRYGIGCFMKVNFVTYYNKETQKREPRGVCYIFFTNSQVYHMLLGRNPDGSERVKFIPDPTWVAPVKEEKKDPVGDKPYSSWDDFGKTLEGRWADIMDDVEITAPMIRVQEPPLLSRISFANAQGELENIKYQASFVTVDPEYAEKYDINKLSTHVPPGVTEEELLKIFKPYSSVDKFPKIHMTQSYKDGKRLVIITFDSRTRDALFAKQVIFTHSFKGVECKFTTPETRGARN